MKKSFQLFLFSTMLGLLLVSNPVYGQNIPLEPVFPGGTGHNNGASKSPEEITSPLSLYYNQTIDQLEFQNLETSSVTFTYYIYDEDENVIDYDTVCINVNASYLLYLNSIVGETYKIQIEVDDVVYEGYFGQ